MAEETRLSAENLGPPLGYMPYTRLPEVAVETYSCRTSRPPGQKAFFHIDCSLLGVILICHNLLVHTQEAVLLCLLLSS
jgi:hypothetical protein